ncbi:MAG: S1C family serine protease [Lachnospirales bacterium]
MEDYVKNEIIIYKPSIKKQYKRLIAMVMVCVIIFGSMVVGIGIGVSIDNFIVKEKVSSPISSPNLALTATTSTDYSNVIGDVSNSVVSINVLATSRDYFGRPNSYKSAGSGIIFSEDEKKVYVATNNHVIDGAVEVTVSVNDDVQIPASYIGSDSVFDLAIVSLDKSDLKNKNVNYSIAIFGNSSDLEVGDTAIAIGNALGMGKTATKGIISALNKSLEIDNSSLQVLQTDAAINSGNSGGPLINDKGEVIGINTAKLKDAEGIGYSIPVDIASPILLNLLESGTSKLIRPCLGIEGISITEELQEYYNLPSPGIFITNILTNSGAYQGGLNIADIIIGINNSEIKNMDNLTKTLENFSIKDTVNVTVIRNNAIITLPITLYKLNNGF